MRNLPGHASVNPLQQDLVHKTEMEAAMLRAPADDSLRDAYFDLLCQFAAGRTGLCHALLPEIGHPLYFRCGTQDVASLAEVFRHDAYGATMASSPLHVLDLGAYAGYAAVYLARRFPQAQILCVEPCAGHRAGAAAEHRPYRRITRLAAAAWPRVRWLEVADMRHGDAGTRLRERPPGSDANIRGLPVADLLLHAGWTHVDLVKCDIQGSEAELFADGVVPWLHTLDALMIRTHDAVSPGAAEIVAACFDKLAFAQSQYGQIRLFERRDPYRAAGHAGPQSFSLLHAEAGLFPLVPQNLPDPHAFFLYDGHSCQLRPGHPADPPAQLVLPRTLSGQSWFSSGIQHAGPGEMTFTVEIRTEDDVVVASARRAAPPGAKLHLSLTSAPLSGRHRIVLRLGREHAEGDAGFARWINPRMS